MPSADAINTWANFALIVSLVVGVIATYAVVVTGNIKEARLKRELAASVERTAQLEKEATEAKLALAKLQDRLAPRRLTTAQARILGEEIRGLVMNIEISVLAHDPEAQAYADQLIEAMNASRSVNGNVTATIFTGAVVGLRMSQTKTPEARRLESALRKAQIPFTFSAATPELRMSIGTKPD